MFCYKKILGLCCIMINVTLPLVAQKTIVVAQPVVTNVPAAFGGVVNDADVKLSVTNDGRFALAYTDHEAKAWKLPEGELIYRYQNAKDRIKGMFLTTDGRYLYTTSKREAADAETGELLQDGILRDSIVDGTYNIQRDGLTLKTMPLELQSSLSKSGSSPLWVKRPDYDNKDYNEYITLRAMAPDEARPGNYLMVYSQQFYGSRKWIEENLKTSFKETRQTQKEGGANQRDFHIASYSAATGKAEYLGKLMDGVEYINYGGVDKINISATDNIVLVSLYKDSVTYHAYSSTGKPLWTTPYIYYNGDLHFDQNGNMVTREQNKNTEEAIAVRNTETGILLTRYLLPGTPYQMQLIPAWGMMAMVSKTKDGNLAITLHNAETGEQMITLTDNDAAAYFATKYKADAAARLAKEEALAARRSAYWAEVNRLNAEAERAAFIKNAAAAADHAKNWQICPKCNGKGYFTNYGYSSGSSKTFQTKRRNEYTGDESLHWETETKPGGSYSTTVTCSRCHGNREVRTFF